jgi:hypothetical protein
MDSARKEWLSDSCFDDKRELLPHYLVDRAQQLAKERKELDEDLPLGRRIPVCVAANRESRLRKPEKDDMSSGPAS